MTVKHILKNMSLCKVVVVGDEGVGKGALVRRFTSGMFVEVHIKFCILQTYPKHVFSGVFSFAECQKPENSFCGKQKN